jgi:hypothetical protein
MAVLMGLAVLLVICSCVTAPKPLAPGELRLVRIQVPGGENINANIPFLVNISFEAGGQPEIRAACFYFSGDGPRCSKVTNVIYGSPGMIRVETRTNYRGPVHLKCYVTYIRDGKIEATNVIGTNFRVIDEKKPSPSPGKG